MERGRRRKARGWRKRDEGKEMRMGESIKIITRKSRSKNGETG
jgi:hypothetical protein